MRYSVIVPALMAASSMAAPAVNMVYETVRVTRTVTAGQDIPAPTPAPAAQVITYAVNQPPAPSPAPEAPSPVAPAPEAPSPSSADVDVGSDDISDEAILNIVNQWRSRFGLGEMRWSQKLADNALEVGRAGNGVNQEHILPPIDGAGKCGQVITPGSNYAAPFYNGRNPFEIAYVSWLCEVPTPETQDICPAVVEANRMAYDTTAHYEELVDPDYTQVGCAFFENPNWDGTARWNGLWTCSLESE